MTTAHGWRIVAIAAIATQTGVRGAGRTWRR